MVPSPSLMNNVLHITSGDKAGEQLELAGLPGEVFIWHDMLYDGPRNPGWPTEETLQVRAVFLEHLTAGGLSKAEVLDTLEAQYQKLLDSRDYEQIVLWFDACLFDQSMLAHILICLEHLGIRTAELLCVDDSPGIDPYHGLGQLSPEQLASHYEHCRPVTEDQFQFAKQVDKAFATQDQGMFATLSKSSNSPLPWVAAAIRRWLQEQPDTKTGLGRLEQLALDAIQSGLEKPREILNAVSAADSPPQYWGDITLWAKINALANRTPSLVHIEGQGNRLPQWFNEDINTFRITPIHS